MQDAGADELRDYLGKDAAHGPVHANPPAVLLAAAAAALAAAAFQLREKHEEAELTVQNIHDELDALDPVSRAAVVARLTSDEVKKVRDQG